MKTFKQHMKEAISTPLDDTGVNAGHHEAAYWHHFLRHVHHFEHAVAGQNDTHHTDKANFHGQAADHHAEEYYKLTGKKIHNPGGLGGSHVEG